MTGNIREWTWPPDGIPLDCRGSRDLIPIRGGSWVTPLKHLGLEQDDMAYAMSQSNIGFRLARNAE